MEEKKNRKGMEFQQSHRKEFHYQRPEVNRIIMPEEKRRREAQERARLEAAQNTGSGFSFKKESVLRICVCAVILCLVVLGLRKIQVIHKERVAAKEFEKQKEAQAKIKRDQWVKRNGKSYYYGKDGNITIGRFVKGKKIYYTDDKGAITRTIDGTKPMVSLTFDDGPSKYTDDIVKVLEKYHCAGTFFEVGERIAEYEEEEQAVADSYSELANHTYSHQILTKVGADAITTQTEKCNEVLRKAGQTDRILFRAPGGGVNDTVKQTVKMPIILWSVDTLDWKIRNAQSVYEKATTNIKDGDIILMHSLYESTYHAVEKIVPELKEQGYQLVTVTDLIEFRGGAKDGQVYMDFPPTDQENGEN